MCGDDVRHVQQALIRAGALASGTADGIFGEKTQAAVRVFQKKLNVNNPQIAVDGIVGRDTWSALFSQRVAVPIDAGPTVPESISPAPPWQDLLRPYLTRLGSDHNNPFGSARFQWKLAREGVLRAAEGAPRRSRGEPKTVSDTWKNFRKPMEKCASSYGVPVELLIATACTETGGKADAVRHEPGYVDDERTPGKVSVGLMQTLISTARSIIGDSSIDSRALLDPEISIRAGAAYIRQAAIHPKNPTNYDPPLVAVAYNAGSLRVAGDNDWGLVQTLRQDRKAHADVFVEFFNDCFFVFASDPPDQKTPSFHTLLP
jgi:soluble lytic murein transglycosylase-like protein